MNEFGDRIEMKVEGLIIDPSSSSPIIILKDMEGSRALPIWVGFPEATAIAIEMKSMPMPRPMTHDLLKNIITKLSARVNHILVNDLRNNTFYAVISITINGAVVEVDSRPSDAIALALRVQAPIYVMNSVLENASSFDTSAVNPEADEAEEGDNFRTWLENIKPKDFGNFEH